MNLKLYSLLLAGTMLSALSSRAQHLWWNLAGQNDATCLYGEITVLATQPTTYYCGANWHPGEPAGGYCGIQHNDPQERRTIFSIWDTSPELHPKVAETDRRTIHGRFGGEGEGGHTHMLWDWKTNETFQFFVRKQPGSQTNTTDALYYVFDRTTKKWLHSATINSPNGGHRSVETLGGGVNSFLENFSGQNVAAPRLALYRLWLGPDVEHLKCLTRAVGDGTWGELHDNFFLASGGTNELDAVFSSLESQYGKPVFGGKGVKLEPLTARVLPAGLVEELNHLPQGGVSKARVEALKNLRFGMFVCWSFSTFSGKEWTPGVTNLDLFAAKDCDTDQWAKTAKEAGMGYILFLTKHHDGFCLWDTQTTDRKVTKAALGRDVLAELRKSCDKYGIKLALYVSEGEWRWPGGLDDPATPEPKKRNQGGANAEMKKAQLKELLTRYGPIEYIWFDHAVGEGGLSHADTVAFCKSLQPDCFIGFNNGMPAGDIRLGEMGHAAPMDSTVGLGLDAHNAAKRDYQGYLLAEFTYPILPEHEGGAMWFYSLPQHDSLCMPVESIYADYLGAVKFGNVFSLDVGPDYNGKLRDVDVKTLQHVGRYIRGDEKPLANDESCVQPTPEEMAKAAGVELPHRPWHVANVWWEFQKPVEHFESLEMDITIDRDVPDTYNLYISPCGIAEINGLQFYGGIQANINGWANATNQTRVHPGKGAIFSRWSHDKKTPIGLEHVRIAGPDCLVESAGYEGEFASVRRPFAWTKGTYTYQIVKGAAEVVEGKTNTWFTCRVKDSRGGVHEVGSLRFEGSDFTYWAKHSAFVEVYSTAKIPNSGIPKVNVTFGWPRVNGTKPELKRAHAYYPSKTGPAAPDCAWIRADGENVRVEVGPIFKRDEAQRRHPLAIEPDTKARHS